MRDSLDVYADNSNFFDIDIVSTLGLTEEDVEEIKKIDGIENSYGAKTKESIAKIEEKESICKVIEYNENSNKPVIIEGRMIENANECLLDRNYFLTDNFSEYIGKTIILENEELNSEDNPIFNQKEFTIVGIAESPLYISSERGNTTIGNGKVDFFIYTNTDVINIDYYTNIYAKVKGAKELNLYSNEYWDLVNPVISKVEEIKEEREVARYNKLVNDAQNELNDAQKEFDEKKKDVDSELSDAQKKINEAKKKISNSENKLKASEKEIEEQESNVKKQFEALEINASNEKKEALNAMKTEAMNKISAGKKDIEKGRKELEKAKAEIKEKEAEFLEKKQEATEKLNDAQKEIDNAKDEISKIEKAKWYVRNRKDNMGYTNIIDAIKTMNNVAKLFPIIFYFVAILISLTSMTRMIEEERTEIGTLKALGYTDNQIILKYILYAFLACVIGGFLGMAVGFYLIPNIVWNIYDTIYKIPEFYASYRLNIGLLGLVIAFICIGGATILVSRKELKNMPSVLMRPKAPKNGKKIALERMQFIWKRFNFSKKVTARNIFRYKKRAIMTIVGIAGCTGLLLTGFGIRDSVMDIPESQYGKIFTYNISISLSEDKNLKDIEDMAKNNENIKNYSKLCASAGKLKGESINYETTIFAVEDKNHFKEVCNLKDVNNNEKIELTNDGIIISDKAAELLKIKQGDSITLIDSDNKEHSFKVVGIAENYVSNYVYMTKEFYENNIKTYKTNMILINTEELTESAENEIVEELLQIDGVASVVMISDAMKAINDMLNSLNYVVIILIVASALLAFVVLYNLANINIGERQREIATLKVLGFFDKEVDNYINKENIIFTLLGVCIGLVFGYFLTDMVIISVEIDKLRFIRNIMPQSYVYAAVISVTFSLIVNYIIHFVLKKIDMIESLKSIE